MRIAALLFFVLMQITAASLAADNTISSQISGQTHMLTIDLPPQKSIGKVYPAIIALHGEIGDGQQMREMTGLDDLGFTEGFIVAFPDANKITSFQNQAAPLFSVGTTHGSCATKQADSQQPLSINCKSSYEWGREPCCEKSLKPKSDDIRYIDGLIDLLVQKYKADPKRIYLIGYNQGAGLSFRYTCEFPEKIAAMAAVGGAEWFVNCKEAQRPVPTLYLHGSEDRCVPYDGEGVCGKCRARYEGLVFNDQFESNQCKPAAEFVKRWLKTDGCPVAGKTINAVGQVTCESWTGCRGGSVFSFCTLQGSGSFWPQGQLGFPECKRAGFQKKCVDLLDWLGPVNQDVNATQMVWDFFKERRLPDKMPVSR